MIDGYKISSNGLIKINKNSVLIFDTPWDNAQTHFLLEYIRDKINKKIIGCIITHSHQDRSGGLYEIAKNNIPIYMTEMTSELLKNTYKYCKINPGMVTFDYSDIDFKYLGPAHSRDNVILYLPIDNVLYAGCIVKSINTLNIGNTADADLGNWKNTLIELIETYSSVKIVVPGHGEPGGPELLNHTLEIVKKGV